MNCDDLWLSSESLACRPSEESIDAGFPCRLVRPGWASQTIRLVSPGPRYCLQVQSLVSEVPWWGLSQSILLHGLSVNGQYNLPSLHCPSGCEWSLCGRCESLAHEILIASPCVDVIRGLDDISDAVTPQSKALLSFEPQRPSSCSAFEALCTEKIESCGAFQRPWFGKLTAFSSFNGSENPQCLQPEEVTVDKCIAVWCVCCRYAEHMMPQNFAEMCMWTQPGDMRLRLLAVHLEVLHPPCVYHSSTGPAVQSQAWKGKQAQRGT